MKKNISITIVLLTMIFSLLVCNYAIAGPGITENVIIAIIDGIRYDEVTPTNMPFILGGIDPATGQPVPDPLKPQGTYYMNFYDTGLTATTPGHQTILTGVRQLLMNNGQLNTRQRTKQPNIFEYYRKQLNIPIEKTWTVAGKGQGNLKHIEYSLHPDYGYGYRSNIYRAETTGHYYCEDPQDPQYYTADDEVRDEVNEVMDTNHPSLMLINFKDVDHCAHELATYPNGYTQAIKKVDEIIYDLWHKIQSDNYYKGKTTLIITTDHGRHSDDPSGHGSHSRGDRHLIFLVLGPDIKVGEEISMRRDQIDIAPTVGALLGFQTRYAEGLVMQEMFVNPDLGDNIITGGSRKPKVAVNQEGIHLVWSEKAGQEWDIYYKKSTDGGVTWTAPIALFQSDDDDFFYEADITAGSTWVYVTATGYSVTDLGGPTYAWKLHGRFGSGVYWSSPEVLTTDLKTMLGPPAIDSYDAAINIAITEKGQKLWSYYGFYSNWTESRIDGQPSKTKNMVSYSVVRNQLDSYAVWPAIFAKDEDLDLEKKKWWNLYLDKYDSSTQTWGVDKLITSNMDDRYFFYDPAVDLNTAGTLRAVWARFIDYVDGSGFWEIFFQQTLDGGQTWTPVNPKKLSSDGFDSWNPDIAFLVSSGTQSVAVWETHDESTSEIQGRLRQGGIWNDIFSITEVDGNDSVEPDITSYQGQVYITWQDMKNGNWGVEFKPISLD